jgi:hypothetical protein
MNEVETPYSVLIAETDLEDRAVVLAYLFAKARRKLNRLEAGEFSPTEHQVEITRAAMLRIRRWCCKNALAIHEKYHNQITTEQ